MTPPVARLSPDSVLEGLLEVRFEHAEVPEVALGLLARAVPSDWRTERLAFADMPAHVRSADPALRYQPMIQCISPSRDRIVKIGERVFSSHVLAPYPGWEIFRPELEAHLRHVTSTLRGFAVTRLGHRYINILGAENHHVESLEDTTLRVTVGGSPIKHGVNVNYIKSLDSSKLMVRASTADLVDGIRQPFNVLIDLDLYQEYPAQPSSLEQIMSWTVEKHDLLKREFFSILSKEVLDRLSR